ncbi:BtrH N-terminal domain-containing protein [Streptomyces sp. NPDC006552]|uniref:BtrH N-terminal domain-containing protein n=1 Tax=Streptomyces sp. NPDC006552 TaxID=3157179 RepID=UPI0033BF337E
MTTVSERVAVSGDIQLWYRDAVSCLQATFATALLRAGHDPLPVLGLHWEFRFQPEKVTSEEFSFPCAPGVELADALMPHHPVRSRWHRAGGQGLEELVAELARDRTVVAAVDNFHLPFRPAYHDVHAAHLLVVTGIDLRAGTVSVADAMPPEFSGEIPLAAFLDAWTSGNPSDEQDAFFSDTGIERRYLTVDVEEPFPVVDRELLRRALAHGSALFHAASPDGDGDHVGLRGLRFFLDDVVERARSGRAGALQHVYPFGWGMQAQAALHGEFLRTWGRAEGLPALAEAGRRVEAVAHAWTGVRVTAAHATAHPPHDHGEVAADLATHTGTLDRAYVTAVQALDEAKEML